MDKEPSFYLASADTGPPIEPRKCYIEERLVLQERGDAALLVRFDRPINRAKFQLPPPPPILFEAVLATRLKGDTIDPVSEWPLDVYICHILNDQFKGTGKVSAKDLSIEYWGEIYPTLEDAEKWIEPYRRLSGLSE